MEGRELDVYVFVVPPGEQEAHQLAAHCMPDVCLASGNQNDEQFIKPINAKLSLTDLPKRQLSGLVTWPSNTHIAHLAEYCPVIGGLIKKLMLEGNQGKINGSTLTGLYIKPPITTTGDVAQGNIKGTAYMYYNCSRTETNITLL